jgi:D-sedoheptulose 7-phosphate isomerase
MQDETLRKQLDETIQVTQYLQTQLPKIREVATMLIEALRAGHRILAVGNGGSALDAQHLASELVGHYRTDHTPLPAFALTSDGGILTAIANDYDFESVFARQVAAQGTKGDVLVAFSTSGKSRNVLKALDKAGERGLVRLGLAGHDGGQMQGRCEYDLFIPFTDTARIQEAHLMFIHLLSEYIDEAFAES